MIACIVSSIVGFVVGMALGGVLVLDYLHGRRRDNRGDR